MSQEPSSQVQNYSYSSFQDNLVARGGGGILTLGAITAGTVYTNGSYPNVPLTGGSGVGAAANITVAGTVVTVVSLTSPGTGYAVGDVLSAAAATIGGTGSGFSIPVTKVGATPATAFSLGTVDVGAMLNRFVTVGAGGAGCALPPAVPGLVITIINSGANPLQVLGQGGDTINGIPGVSGVPMMVNSTATFYCLTTGIWFSANLGSGFTTTSQGGAIPTFSTQNNITASTTHSIAGGVPIVASQAEIRVVANAGDAVTLPLAQPGMEITIVNNGALSAGVYPQATDQINAGGLGTPFTQVVGVTLYFCFTPNLWVTK
jgi:hypothetical protein